MWNSVYHTIDQIPINKNQENREVSSPHRLPIVLHIVVGPPPPNIHFRAVFIQFTSIFMFFLTEHPGFQPIQQQYPSGIDNYGPSQGGMGDRSPLPEGWDSDAPPECGTSCDNLDNCINVTSNYTCCPECIEYGCICEGQYQVNDCERNGFKWVFEIIYHSGHRGLT